MSLLAKQDSISSQFPLPSATSTESYRIHDVAAEAVTFYVASTGVADVGSAAGTIVYAHLTNTGVLDSAKDRVGSLNDTSFAFVTGTCLTTQVTADWLKFELATTNGVGRATRFAELAANFANGQFALDHRMALIIGKKATSATGDTANYSYRTALVTTGGGGGGGTSSTDNSVFATGTDGVTPAGFLVDELATGSVTEGNVGVGRMTTDRKVLNAANFKEDSAHVSTDYGTFVLSVRNDAGTSMGADGDYVALQTDSTGALRVTGAAGFVDDAAFTQGTTGVTPVAFLADESGTDSVDENDAGAARMTLNRRIITASSSADDAAPETGTKPSMAGFVFDDAAPDSVDEGDLGYARMSANRNQYQTIRDAAGNERGANVDANSRLTTEMQSIPGATSTFTPDMDTSAAAEASSVTKASAGVLYGATATNSSASTRFFQLFNSTTVPADTTVPVVSLAVAAGGTVGVDYGLRGRFFSTGIAWCWSSTAATKTVGSTDGIADVLYK